MDPPQRQNSSIQRQDACVPDPHMPLNQLYESPNGFPDDAFSNATAPPPAGWLWGPEAEDLRKSDQCSTGSVRQPPPLPRTSLPSTSPTHQHHVEPPPVPPRTRAPSQRQDAQDSDLHQPLTDDLDGVDLYKGPEGFPDNDTHFYEDPLSVVTNLAAPPPPGWRWGHEAEDPRKVNRTEVVHGPPPPLRTRLPSACLPGQHPTGPPPVPPRSRAPPIKQQQQHQRADLPQPNHRLKHSRTQVENQVSQAATNDFIL